MKSAVLVQARTSSTRLPGKIYAGIPEENSKPLLAHVMQRIEKSGIPGIILVPENDEKLIQFCKEFKFEFFTGSELDVRDRYRRAVKKFNLDYVVRATGDNPCVDSDCIRNTLNALERECVSLLSFKGYPLGMAVEAFTTEALFSEDEFSGPEYSEHVSLHIKHGRLKSAHPEIENIQSTDGIRLTVDTDLDLEVVRSVFRELGDSFGIKEVLHLAREKPGIFMRNAHVEQITFKKPESPAK